MPVEALRTIGIDPGSRVTGIGVVEARGQSLHYIHSECVRTGTGSLGSRLVQIHQRIREVISRFQPVSGAIEKVFVSANPQSALVLGQARGSALLALAESDLEISEYSALEIKRAITGTGRADKEQVQHMVRVLLGMDRKPPQDAADALACAICHLHHAEGRQRQTVAQAADPLGKPKGLQQ